MIEKDIILIKSAEIISQRGMENYSMSTLSDEIGIKKASIYYYYRSKEEIISAMHEFFHMRLIRKSYKINLNSDASSASNDLVRHWEDLFLSEEFYDYLRTLLILRSTEEKSYDAWRSIALTIEGQCGILCEKFTKNAALISPLLSSYLEISLERALINGYSDFNSVTAAFAAMLSHGR